MNGYLKPAGLVAAGLLAASGSVYAQEEQFITIGTGGVTGVYYPAGGAICRLVNAGRDEHGLRCSVESTGGSVYNVNTVQAGELDFGVSQSDIQFNAYNGLGDWEGRQFEDLRAVFALHPEPFTLVASAGSGIESFEDIPGARVQVGPPGSGTYVTMERVMEAYGMSMDDLALAAQLAPAEQSAALCDNQIDAFVYVVGHPSAAIQEATTTCDAVLGDVAGEPIQGLLEEYPYYSEAVIPGGMYRGNEEDTNIFGVRATFVTSADVPEEVVYQVTRAVFENFEEFQQLHPAFANLTKEEMVAESLSAPLHDGARRYYEEAGLPAEGEAGADAGGEEMDAEAEPAEETAQ